MTITKEEAVMILTEIHAQHVLVHLRADDVNDNLVKRILALSMAIEAMNKQKETVCPRCGKTFQSEEPCQSI